LFRFNAFTGGNKPRKKRLCALREHVSEDDEEEEQIDYDLMRSKANCTNRRNGIRREAPQKALGEKNEEQWATE